MSNDKKPKKAKPAVVHGSSNRGKELNSKIMEPLKVAPSAAGKKKK